MDKYKVTIGLEIHVALKTKSKLFSRSASHFESDTFSLFDAGVPGFMPVLSDQPIEMALKFAHAVKAEIPTVSIFERKHYFYPDLPLGYQITQQHNPIMIGGQVPITIGKEIKYVQIEHAHLECDAAKSLHDKFNSYTAIDLSRCSTPLLEIVSTPCMHSPEEAKAYAMSVCALVKYLDICDGKLEEGSFRVDASISLSKTEQLGTRVEIKNISSFSFLQSALEYEIDRQSEVLDSGEKVDLETRLFHESSLSTQSMRKKETVHEYRYMPDPDIPPIVLDQEYINSIKTNFKLDYYSYKKQLEDVLLLNDIQLDASALLSSNYKDIWLKVIEDTRLQTERFLKILGFWIPEILVRDAEYKKLSLSDLLFLDRSGLQARECKEVLLKYKNETHIEKCMPVFLNDTDLSDIVKSVLIDLSKQVEQYQSGDEKILQFIIGKVMSKVKGKAPANTVKEKVILLLKSS